MADWTDGRSARGRVRQIIDTVTDPVSVNWVSQQADVGWQTAKDELEDLAERGGVRRVTQGETVRYVPNFTQMYIERIRDLVVSYSRDTLQEELIQAKAEIESLEARFDVDSRDALEASIANDEVSAEAARDRQQALTAWQEIADQKRLLQHALCLYDDLRAVDPFVEPSARGDGTPSDT